MPAGWLTAPRSLDPTLTWVFAHGSLMFRPGFEYTDRRAARILGYARRFGQPSVRNWGRPEHPAPTCSLVPGRAVDGVAFGITEDRRAAILKALRSREDREPTEVRAQIDGHAARVLTWTMSNPWAGHSVAELVSAAVLNIRRGGGPFGDAWNYLDGVRRSLDRLGRRDRIVEDYHAALTVALRNRADP